MSNFQESDGLGHYPWFALQVRTKHELTIANVLRGKGYAPFAPLYTCRRQWSDRVKVVQTPLFPGYLFCRLNLQNRLPVLTTPGVRQIVGFGRVPAEIDPAEIGSLQTMVAAGVASRPCRFLQAGDLVEIEHGPLRGLRGILVEVRGSSRILLSVTLLKRSVAVEIDDPGIVRVLNGSPGLNSAKNSKNSMPQITLKKDVSTMGKVFSSTVPLSAPE
jgi:transcription antitermination factor NusG